MVKSVLGVYHQGLHDWLTQRVTALIIAIYSIGILLYFFLHPGLTFAEWHTLFSSMGMKIFTVLFLIAMLSHAWVGMWTILTDYVKNFSLRLCLHFIILLTLFLCFIWGVMILWSI